MTAHDEDTLESADARPEGGSAPHRRVAILSDVHGNLPALEAVLADIERHEVDACWSLGDLVGYGAQPDDCVARAREACEISLVGNHDLVVIDRLDIDAFSAGAAAAARWTRDHIDPEAVRYLGSLAPQGASHGVGLYHASPRDPVWEYVLSNGAADGSMEAMDHRVGLIGHSHVALCFRRSAGGTAAGEVAPGGTTADVSEGDWLVNPGAVGQPRDGDPRAAWLLLDLETWTASWQRVEYDIDGAATAIREAGLPAMLADRLYYGQ